MSSEEGKKCPPEVLQMKKERLKEEIKLKAMLKGVRQKLALATAGEVRVRTDVTLAAAAATQEQEGPKLKFYLLQPKAKAGSKGPPYLAPTETVVLHDEEDGWVTARLNSRTAEYRDSSYHWSYHVLPADGAQGGGGQLRYSFFHPGELWGALRGLDPRLDLARLDLQVPAGPQVSYTVTTTCEQCEGGEVKLFEEEVAHLQAQVPFTCDHGLDITAVQPGTSAEGLVLWTPRPGYPMLPPPGTKAPSFAPSSFTAPRLQAREKDVREQLARVLDAHAELADAISNCNEGEITGYKDLEEEVMEGYLEACQEEVEVCLHDAEEAMEELERMQEFQEGYGGEDGEDGEDGAFQAGTAELGATRSQAIIGSTRARFRSEYAAELDRSLRSGELALSTSASLALQQQATAEAPHHPSSIQRLPPPLPTTPRSSKEAAFYHKVISPESQQLLKRKKIKLENDVKEVEERVKENEAGATEFMADKVEMAIAKVEALLDEVMQIYSQQLRAKLLPPTCPQALSRDKLHEDCCSWARSVRRRNWASVRKAPAQAPAAAPTAPAAPPQVAAAHLERAKLPKFDGKTENWFDFKRRFQELIKAYNSSPVLEMTFLVNCLAEDAAKYILGVTEPAAAWALLDRRYGDRSLAIMTTRHRLINLKLAKGPAHDQVESLVIGLRHARWCLSAVDAEGELFIDLSMVGILLSKLPHGVQQRWYVHRARLPPTTSATEEGQFFQQWLDMEGEAAVHQRRTILSTELSRGPAPAPTPAPALAPGAQVEAETDQAPLRDQLPLGTSRLAANLAITTKGRPRYSTKEEAEAAAAVAASRMDPCPACQGGHTFTRSFSNFTITVPWPSNRLEACPEFRKMSPAQRAAMMEGQAACVLCTAVSHREDRCWQQTHKNGVVFCSVKVGGAACGGRHHSLLHGSKSSYCAALTAASSSRAQLSSQAPTASAGSSLFELLQVPVASPCGSHTASALVMIDPGSTDNFITHKLAAQLQLPGTPHTLHIRVLDQEYRETPTMAYHLDLVDMAGVVHRVEALGMHSITDVQAAPETTSLARLFPGAPPAAAAAFSRPHGAVNLMIGMRDRRLHSTDCLEHQNLRLGRTRFTPGWVLTGHSGLLTFPTFSSEWPATRMRPEPTMLRATQAAPPSAPSPRPQDEAGLVAAVEQIQASLGQHRELLERQGGLLATIMGSRKEETLAPPSSTSSLSPLTQETAAGMMPGNSTPSLRPLPPSAPLGAPRSPRTVPAGWQGGRAVASTSPSSSSSRPSSPPSPLTQESTPQLEPADSSGIVSSALAPSCAPPARPRASSCPEPLAISTSFLASPPASSERPSPQAPSSWAAIAARSC